MARAEAEHARHLEAHRTGALIRVAARRGPPVRKVRASSSAGDSPAIGAAAARRQKPTAWPEPRLMIPGYNELERPHRWARPTSCSPQGIAVFGVLLG